MDDPGPRHARSSGAPGAAELAARALPRLVASGSHLVFLPLKRLRPAARTALGTDLDVIDGAGPLVVEEHPTELAALVGGR
ncbi:hypothetical protein O1L60_40825 [Streptomyces diastatochromogenes]|nr:hypothetical protein [Streptomyces diastatochromogenes]